MYKFWQSLFSIKQREEKKYLTLLGLEIEIDKSRHYNPAYDNLPLDSKKIVFSNYSGNYYGCNPKYIAEEILKKHPEFKIVWLVKNVKTAKKSGDFPKNIKLVKLKSKESMQELATSKFWVDNMRKNYHFMHGLKKKPGQIYIQTWHGSIGIKKMEKAFKNENAEWRKYAQIDSKNIDYIPSNCLLEDNIFANDFWYSGPILKIGHPRNDIFFKNEEEKLNVKSKVFSKLNIKNEKKVILYMPTFRDDGDLSFLNIDLYALIQEFERKFGGEWVVGTRLHPNMQKFASKLFKYSDKIVNCTSYPDIQELFVAFDSVITDYSSGIFDFMLTKKPGFIYAPDIEKYNTERGFYYSLESAPFPISRTNEELQKCIKDFNIDYYKNKVANFLQDKKCYENGNASEQISELIYKLSRGEKV